LREFWLLLYTINTELDARYVTCRSSASCSS